MARSYKILGQGLINNAANTTLYTVPANKSASVTYFCISNVSGAARTVEVWLVPSGDSADDTTKIRHDMPVPADRQHHLAGGDSGIIHLAAGDTIQAKSSNDALSLCGTISGVESDV